MDNASHNGAGFLLLMMRTLVTACCVRYVRHCGGVATGRLPDPLTLLGEGHPWPIDIRTAIDALEIDPETVVMACCKTCRAVYEPSLDKNLPYPTLCTNKAFLWGTPCGARLTKDASGKGTPLYPFLYQRMETWLNRMLSRKVVVEGIQQVSRSWADRATKVTDMIFGRALQELLGPDVRPFMAAPAGELRLAFTLNVDWFNPFGRRTAGKHASVGGVYMVYGVYEPSHSLALSGRKHLSRGHNTGPQRTKRRPDQPHPPSACRFPPPVLEHGGSFRVDSRPSEGVPRSGSCCRPRL